MSSDPASMGASGADTVETDPGGEGDSPLGCPYSSVSDVLRGPFLPGRPEMETLGLETVGLTVGSWLDLSSACLTIYIEPDLITSSSLEIEFPLELFWF